MTMLRPLLLTLAFAACIPWPQRRATPPRETLPAAQVDLHLLNRLGDGWTLRYLQVYADGWLLWQGEGGGAGTISLGRHALRGAGAQEIHVRAVATRRGEPGGHLGSNRQLIEFRPGVQRVYVRLSPDLFHPGTFDVVLSTG